MDGEQIMYKVRPFLYSDEKVDTPDCMYTQKSFQCDEQMEVSESPDAVIQALEKRQDDILKRLEELKMEVDNLSKRQSKAAPSRTSNNNVWNSAVHLCKPEESGQVVRDIVISANPRSPPYSLLILQNLLAQQYKVLAASYTHSSALDVEDKLKSVYVDSGEKARNSFQLAFTLIWKDVNPSPSLMVNPIKQTAIHGEGPIARYISRLLNPSYENGSIVQVTEIDALVDSATQLLKGNNKEKAAVLRTMNGKLGKSDWLVGNELSLADIVLWSALQQSKQAEGCPANVQKWLKKCAQMPAFQSVMGLL